MMSSVAVTLWYCTLIWKVHSFTRDITNKWIRDDLELDSFQSSTIDSDGNIFLLGFKEIKKQNYEYLLKINGTNGDEIWSIDWLSSIKDVVSISTDEYGDVVLVGMTSQSLYSSYFGGISDIIIEKFHGLDGIMKWGRQYGTNRADVVTDVKYDEGQILLTGYTSGVLFNSQSFAGDSYFLAAINNYNGDILNGLQSGFPSTKDQTYWSRSFAIHCRTEYSNITNSLSRYLVVLGDTNGLDSPVNDGGDIFIRYYEINSTSLNMSTVPPSAPPFWLPIWSQQYDCRTSKDHLISSVLEVNITSPSIFVMCHLYLLKIDLYRGTLRAFQQIQTKTEKVYSIATHKNLFFQLSSRNVKESSLSLPLLSLETTVSRLPSFLNGYRFRVDYNPLAQLNSSTSVTLTGATLFLLPFSSLYINMEEWAAGDYLLLLQMQITTSSRSEKRISLEYVTLQYHNDCCHYTIGYSISSPVVIFLIIFHGIFPIVFLIWYHISLHPTTGSFFSSLCALWLPIFSQMINLLYLLTVRFYYSAFFWSLLVDLYLVPMIPLFFYEYILHISENFTSTYDQTFLSTIFSSKLTYTFSIPPTLLSLQNYLLLSSLKCLDVIFFSSINARAFLILRLLPFIENQSSNNELTIMTTMNSFSWDDCLVIIIYLALRCLKTLTLILLLFLNLFLCLIYLIFEFLFKYFFYYFFFLSYFYSSYSEYTTNNQSTFRIGSNYQFISHTIFISFFQFLIQFLNTCYMGSLFTPFIILCLVTNSVMMIYCFYRYGIKYIVYVVCIKSWTLMEWQITSSDQEEKRKQGYYRKNQVGVVYISNEEDDEDIEMEDAAGS